MVGRGRAHHPLNAKAAAPGAAAFIVCSPSPSLASFQQADRGNPSAVTTAPSLVRISPREISPLTSAEAYTGLHCFGRGCDSAISGSRYLAANTEILARNSASPDRDLTVSRRNSAIRRWELAVSSRKREIRRQDLPVWVGNSEIRGGNLTVSV